MRTILFLTVCLWAAAAWAEEAADRIVGAPGRDAEAIYSKLRDKLDALG